METEMKRLITSVNAANEHKKVQSQAHLVGKANPLEIVQEIKICTN